MTDQPLGPVLHIIGNDAVVRPHKGFIAKGATVVTLDNEVVGKLDYPIGRVDHPFQVIKLGKKVSQNLIGKLVIAKLRDSKSGVRKQKDNKKRGSGYQRNQSS